MSLPLEHLSSTSISLFLRCPRQFQEVYIRGRRGPPSGAIVLGSAVHLGLSRCLKGEDPGNYWQETLAEYPEIDWGPGNSEKGQMTWAVKMMSAYYEKVGKNLEVLNTEKEVLIELPGVDIPVLGYVDIETPRGIIDIKTTGYVSKSPIIQPSWKLQMNIYQLEFPKGGEFHVLTRNNQNPLVIPDSVNHPFYVPPPDNFKVMLHLAQIYSVMKHYYEEWGEEIDWPGNITHDWAAKYCPLGDLCCQK